MNKLFLKVGAIVLGAGLVVGSGVAIAAHKESFKAASAAMPSGYTLITTSNLSSLTTSDKVVIATSDGSEGVTGWNGNKDATVAASGWLEFQVTNVAASTYSLKDADSGKWISTNASNDFKIQATSQTTLTAKSDGKFAYVDSKSATRNLIHTSTYYRCYVEGTSGTAFYVYKAPAQTGSITSVTVKGPNNETGSMTASAGYAGIPTIQLTADVQKTGTIDNSVQWSVDNSSLAEVDSTGKVRLLAAGSPVITATSKADSTKHSSITINATAITNYPNLTDLGDFTNTAVWGTTTISAGEFSGSLTNVSFADGGTESGNNGVAYNKEGNMRVYNNTILALSTSPAYQIEYVIITCKSTGKLSAVPTCPNGTFSILELSGVLDCSSNPSNEIKITFGGTSHIETLKVYYSSTGSCGVSINNAINAANRGDSGTFVAVTSNATNPVVTWSSSDSDVISINSSTGAYSVDFVGHARITASMTCDEGSDTAFFDVTVTGQVSVAEALGICGDLGEGNQTDYKVTISAFLVNLNPNGKTAGSENQVTLADYKVGGSGNDILVHGIYNDTKLSGKVLREFIVLNGTLTLSGNLKDYGGTFEVVSPSSFSYSDDAMTFAKSSYEALNTACETGPAAVTNEAWNALATAWASVDSNSQVKLREATSSYEFSDDIAHWIDRYDRIVASGKADFMGRTSGSNRINRLVDNHVALIVILSSSIAVISAVALVFVLKRKKHN